MIISLLKNPFSLVLLVALSFSIISCDEDLPPAEESNNTLEGSWSASSYSEGGVEFIGTQLSAYNLTFSKSGATDGTYSAMLTDLTGTNSQLSSTYTVVDDGNRIKIGPDTLDMTVSSSRLTLSGARYFISSDVNIVATKQ